MRTGKYKCSEVKLSISFTKFGNTVLENYVRKEMKGGNVSTRNLFSHRNPSIAIPLKPKA